MSMSDLMGQIVLKRLAVAYDANLCFDNRESGMILGTDGQICEYEVTVVFIHPNKEEMPPSMYSIPTCDVPTWDHICMDLYLPDLNFSLN